MKERSIFAEELISFCICTTCITILEGIMGMMFYPKQVLYYDAFFSPPMFGLFSVLLGLVTYSRKELNVKQVIFRRILHLFLIELMVFTVNFVVGVSYPLHVLITLAVLIAVVFVLVYVILWINDTWDARRLNRKLRDYQKRNIETV